MYFGCVWLFILVSNPIMKQLYKERNYTNLTVGDWDTTQKPISRTIRYMLPANSFSDGSMATETQTMVVDEEVYFSTYIPFIILYIYIYISTANRI